VGYEKKTSHGGQNKVLRKENRRKDYLRVGKKFGGIGVEVDRVKIRPAFQLKN